MILAYLFNITFFSTVAICNINYDYDMNLLALHFFLLKQLAQSIPTWPQLVDFGW